MIYFSLASCHHYAIGFRVPMEAPSTSRDEVDSKFDTGLAQVDRAKSRFSSSSLTSYNDTSVMSALQFTVPTSSPQSSCQRLRPAPVTRGQSLRLSAWGSGREREGESVPNVLLVLRLSHVTRCSRHRRREKDRGYRHRRRRPSGVALGCSSWFFAARASACPSLALSNSKRCFLFLPLC